LGANEVDNRHFDRRVRQVAISAGEEVAQVPSEDHFVGRPVQFDSGGVRVAELLQAGDGGEFEFGLGPPPVRHAHPPLFRVPDPEFAGHEFGSSYSFSFGLRIAS